jgi:regulator of cell morphogenesis and NO signaling
MTTLDLDRTLGDLVASHPGAAAVFERLGIDYCCHGQRSLHEAATAAGLDARAVFDEVRQAQQPAGPDGAPGQDLRHLSPTELADHIEATHHAYLHAELPRLVELTAKIAAVHGDRHPELHEVARTVVELHDDMEPHMAKEERILFPMIRTLDTGPDSGEAVPSHCGSVANPIARMMQEHELTGEILSRLRTLTDGFQVPADGCGSYTAAYEGLARVELDTHQHIHKENNLLFPAAMALL